MEFRLVILSVACFACCIPEAYTFNLVAARAVADQARNDLGAIRDKTVADKEAVVVKAASDIASIAASALILKGKVLKTAAYSIAGAIVNGALSMGATIAKAGVNAVAASLGSQPPLIDEPSAIVLQTPVIDEPVQEIVEYEPFSNEI